MALFLFLHNMKNNRYGKAAAGSPSVHAKALRFTPESAATNTAAKKGSHSPGTNAQQDVGSHGNAYAPSSEDTSSDTNIAPVGEIINGEVAEAADLIEIQEVSGVAIVPNSKNRIKAQRSGFDSERRSSGMSAR